MKKWLTFGFILGLQFWLLSQLTTFVAPEFSLYPYFAARGLLPYRQVIDQHFPLIFFGPLHLGSFGLASPSTLLGVYLFLIAAINLLFWRLAGLKTKTLGTRALLQFGLVTGLVLLSVNHLWLETFSLFFILVGLQLLSLQTNVKQSVGWLKFQEIFAGIFFGVSFVIRPLLLPFMFLLWWQNKRSRMVFVGGLVVVLFISLWLSQHQLWPDFFELLRFNGQYYRTMAARLPNRSELIRLSWVLGWLLLIWRNGRWFWLAAAASLLPSYPRFELFHNLLLLSLPVWPQAKVKAGRFAKLWLALGFILVIRQIKVEPNINFFTSDDLYRQAAITNKYQPNEVYFFGGPDQLYVLTNTLPPGGFYLPSLPWYHANPAWVEKQIRELQAHPRALVVVNTASRLGNEDLLHYSQRLWAFINQNYQLLEETGPLEIWSKSSAIAKYEDRH